MIYYINYWKIPKDEHNILREWLIENHIRYWWSDTNSYICLYDDSSAALLLKLKYGNDIIKT